MTSIVSLPRRSWVEAERRRVALEQTAMAALAPELVWDAGHPAGGWDGYAPVWPFGRDAPPGLDVFLAGRRLLLRVDYPQAFPLAEPVLWPVDPEPPIIARTDHRWHLNGSGSLCLLRTAADWTGQEPAAELVRKAAGWFLEYLLMEAGTVTEMTEAGLVADTSRDTLFAAGVG